MRILFGRKLLLFFFTSILALLLIPRVFAQEVQKADLSLTPSNQSVATNQTFNVKVEIDGKSNKISAADLRLNFDPEFLQVESITEGSYLPTVLVPGEIDNSNGAVSIVLGAAVNNTPTGKGTLATLQIKALKTTQLPSKIIINPDSAVAVIGQSSNMLGLINDGSVTIGETEIVKTVTFELTSTNSTFQAGEEFVTTLRVTSSADSANLFSADIDFDPGLLEVTKIDKDNSFVTQWVTDSFNNTTGKIKLTGGVPAPGFKTPELGSDVALIYFKAKKAGTALNSFSSLSAVYRNSDNADILKSTTPLIVEILPASTPSPTPTPIPSSSPSATPTPTPSATPTATPTSSPSPSPTATPPCAITAASWSIVGPITQGTLVNLSVTGTEDCNGKEVTIKVKEDDGILGSQNAVTNPGNAIFNGTLAQTSWISEYQPDGLFGVWDPPEYFFNAELVGGAAFKSANRVTVTKLLAGQSPKGDGDYDGTINLKDLSMMFTHWNKDSKFSFNLDMNDDGMINSFDFSTLTQILTNANIL